MLEETGSLIYVQEENWETSITICLDVLNTNERQLYIDFVNRHRPNALTIIT